MMRMLALLTLLAATPSPVTITDVSIDAKGGATVESRRGAVAVVFSRDGQAFTCEEFGKVERWRPYVAYLRSVAEQASANPNADFGFALEGAAGLVGVSAPGYCNMTASTRGGQVILIVAHNRACFGSAGCVIDTLAYVPDTAHLAALADAIESATLAASPTD